jgi:hypothetical protein
MQNAPWATSRSNKVASFIFDSPWWIQWYPPLLVRSDIFVNVVHQRCIDFTGVKTHYPKFNLGGANIVGRQPMALQTQDRALFINTWHAQLPSKTYWRHESVMTFKFSRGLYFPRLIPH